MRSPPRNGNAYSFTMRPPKRSRSRNSSPSSTLTVALNRYNEHAQLPLVRVSVSSCLPRSSPFPPCPCVACTPYAHAHNTNGSMLTPHARMNAASSLSSSAAQTPRRSPVRTAADELEAQLEGSSTGLGTGIDTNVMPDPGSFSLAREEEEEEEEE